eukprot:2369275-Lingulodinium_polyedra.AAC.1
MLHGAVVAAHLQGPVEVARPRRELVAVGAGVAEVYARGDEHVPVRGLGEDLVGEGLGQFQRGDH